MNEQNVENDYYSEPDGQSEERNLNMFLGMAFLVVWIISMFFLFYQN